VIENLKKKGFHDQELHVIIALLLGQQQEISKEIIADYRYAGAVHILSVSGLHVGLLMAFVSFLLGFFPSSKKANFIKLVVLIGSLWLFAIVAGLAPCVVRSVTMFSCLAIGNYLNRASNTYYTLLISSLLILFFEPTFLFDVGFQLSYIALFSIVWPQPYFGSFWQPKNKIINYFWNIVTVSFAAQIGSFPVILYYFHQFPGLFFVTNLAVLPFLSCIMLMGLFVILMAFFDCIWTPLMLLLEKSIKLLNLTVGWIASFKEFIFEDISFNLAMMLCSYAVIICWFVWLKKPNYIQLRWSLLTVILLQLTFIFTKYNAQTNSEFVVFNEKRSSLFVERNGQNTIIYAPKNRLHQLEQHSNLKAYLVANFSQIKSAQPLSNFYSFNNEKIMVVDSSCVYLPNEKGTIVVLTGSPRVNVARLIYNLKPKVIVADGSNFKSSIALWKQTCLKENILFHDVRDLGYFILSKGD
jgi:competence protein ComEC